MRHEQVRDYYGSVLKGTGDLKTDACCDASAVPERLRPLLAAIHSDVTARYYGCGTVVPEALDGATVLDLGCGTGRDVYLLAQLVGPEGRVIGVDMTPEQLAVARGTLDWHRDRMGARAPRIEFHEGLIEELDRLPLEPGSVDVIVSNCVVNLSPDKATVLGGAVRLLKEGGEFHFSDVYADRRVPDALRDDPVLAGECLGGALYWRDFERLAAAAGFAAPRRMRARGMSVTDPALAAKTGPVRFSSVDCRLFRLADDPGAEDYGQTARYLGGLNGDLFTLDEGLVFPAGEDVPVPADAFAALAASRLAPFFALDAGDGVHRGAFGAAAVPSPAPIACCG